MTEHPRGRQRCRPLFFTGIPINSGIGSTGVCLRSIRAVQLPRIGQRAAEVFLGDVAIHPGCEHLGRPSGLLAVEGVAQAAARKVEVHGHATIHAWVAPARAGDPERLQRALRVRLPDYMLPSAIGSLPVLPTTGSGKSRIIRRATTLFPGVIVPALNTSTASISHCTNTEGVRR